MSKPQDDKAPADKAKPIPHSDGSFFSDGSGYSDSRPDIEPVKDSTEKDTA